MDPLEAEIHRTVAVLEEMRARYAGMIPEVYLKHFKAAVNHCIATAKRPLLIISNGDHHDD
ncbi:hypothetical protein [Ralstonia pseudosolanacearum]|uniref:hypothetical protein n=1 Tax=Ralstonia pseudosolanacearum TaxID=1310165 RepID=UPI00048F42A5|nr:hypothetical protein [Ralstonia pseudosolanacearum]MDO3558426.1 hypothetical protein [Ralstonia pseudosolanacearum]MDO3587064.1 hypothetical protein [Ralstonia pseudosolanacearum]